MKVIILKINPQERDTILAALRLWKEKLSQTALPFDLPDGLSFALHKIASGEGTHTALTAEEVSRLIKYIRR